MKNENKMFEAMAAADGFERKLSEQEADIWTDGFIAAMKVAVNNAAPLFGSRRDAVESLFKEIAGDEKHGDEFTAAALHLIMDGAEEDDWVDSALRERGIEAAVRFLERRGCKVLEREWSDGVDIIAEEGDGTITFTQVTVQRGEAMVEEAPSKAKRRRMEAAATKYLIEQKLEDGTAVRFDNVTIATMGGDKAMLRHHMGFFNETV